MKSILLTPKRLKTPITFIFFFLCSFFFPLSGEIVESSQVSSLLKYVDQETLVICDVDNTLIESTMHLGSSQWRKYIKQKAIQAGYGSKESEEILDKFWFFVQSLTPVQTVDPETSTIIQQLQHLKIKVIALTARDPIKASLTQTQLASVNICLANSFFKESEVFPLTHASLYQQGILYSGTNKKGEVLTAFFQKTGYFPKKVVFIDDRLDQVIDLEPFLSGLGIQYIGIRFSGADDRGQFFNPHIADLQWSLLPRIISNDEATQILETYPRI